MFAKRFFYVCAGLLCLALAYHFGAQSAGAQVVSGNPVVAYGSGGNITGGNFVAVTANGDVYGTSDLVSWNHLSNVFTGAVPVVPQSIGQLKARYR